MKNEIKHTAHSTYRCEYHIVFAPKYRRKEIYGQLKKDIGEIIRKLCNEKKVEIIEAEACPDHIHMLVSVPPYISIAQFMGFLKGKSTLMIFDRHANLKYKYGSRNFWCRGYYVDTSTRPIVTPKTNPYFSVLNLQTEEQDFVHEKPWKRNYLKTLFAGLLYKVRLKTIMWYVILYTIEISLSYTFCSSNAFVTFRNFSYS